MTTIARRAMTEKPDWKYPQKVFVVSDLHLGGRGAARLPQGQGVDFRMCSEHGQRRLVQLIRRHILPVHTLTCPAHLVINGDFIDFLAEPDVSSATGYAAFTFDESVAVAKLQRILDQPGYNFADGSAPTDGNLGCSEVFEALADFVTTPGTYLTILLGNHDLELAWKESLKALATKLGADQGCVYFCPDGSPLILGEKALYIDHGNRVDAWNRVNYKTLMRYMGGDRSSTFAPPPGSDLVVRIMNKIKEKYSFVDLLKPEKRTAIPILWFLADKPEREKLVDHFFSINYAFKVLYNKIAAVTNFQSSSSVTHASQLPLFEPPIPYRAAKEVAWKREREVIQGPETIDRQSLAEALREELVLASDIESFLTGQITAKVAPAANTGFVQKVGAIGQAARSEPMRSSYSAISADAQRVIQESLLRTIQLFYADNPQALSIYEGKDETTASALKLLKIYQVVIYGHTHLIKRRDLANGHSYCNLGTFADLMLVPEPVFSPVHSATPATTLHTLLLDLENNQLAAHRKTLPGFAQVDIDGHGHASSPRLAVIADDAAEYLVDIPAAGSVAARDLPSLWDVSRAVDKLASPKSSRTS